ncbi:twisted gastrulation protein homolog 1-like [Cetorhinus maximus]
MARLTLLPLLMSGLVSSAVGCNKALCASDVSKCLLQELCQCQPVGSDCPCCRECMLCLGVLWDQCCGCIGLCSERSRGQSKPSSRSSLEDLPLPIPSLFRALSTVWENDQPMDWTIVSINVEEELRQRHHPHHLVLGPSRDLATGPGPGANATAACTVVYFNACMSINRCRHSCESMGATKYRWFHNACCECVGPDCRGYGSKEVGCARCNT